MTPFVSEWKRTDLSVQDSEVHRGIFSISFARNVDNNKKTSHGNGYKNSEVEMAAQLRHRLERDRQFSLAKNLKLISAYTYYSRWQVLWQDTIVENDIWLKCTILELGDNIVG